MEPRGLVEDDLIVDYCLFDYSFVEHLLVPFLKSFRFRNFLLRRMRMEDVVVAFRRGTRPDMRPTESQLLHELKVAEENLLVDARSLLTKREEVHTVEIRDIDTSARK